MSAKHNLSEESYQVCLNCGDWFCSEIARGLRQSGTRCYKWESVRSDGAEYPLWMEIGDHSEGKAKGGSGSVKGIFKKNITYFLYK